MKQAIKRQDGTLPMIIAIEAKARANTDALSCVLCDKQGKSIEIIGRQQRKNRQGSIVFTEGARASPRLERILIDLWRLPGYLFKMDILFHGNRKTVVSIMDEKENVELKTIAFYPHGYFHARVFSLVKSNHDIWHIEC
jgi:hypothetical protein